MKLTQSEEKRLLELEGKNSSGPDPRLTESELNELQKLLDKQYDQKDN